MEPIEIMALWGDRSSRERAKQEARDLIASEPYRFSKFSGGTIEQLAMLIDVYRGERELVTLDGVQMLGPVRSKPRNWVDNAEEIALLEVYMLVTFEPQTVIGEINVTRMVIPKAIETAFADVDLTP